MLLLEEVVCHVCSMFILLDAHGMRRHVLLLLEKVIGHVWNMLILMAVHGVSALDLTTMGCAYLLRCC